MPSLQQTRWTALWSWLGARGDGRQIFHQLLSTYSASSRAYHNAAHIQHCLTELDGSRGLAQRPDEIEAALWFHDAVYVPGRSDNEHRSGELAHTALSEAGVNLDAVQRVVAMVLATRHEAPVDDLDTQLVCDIDLSILGSAPAQFDEFERQIRQEYLRVPSPLYRRSRAAVLRRFLLRPSIYQTAAFRARYETAARENLERLLVALSK
jgi:predicted metal-dependent HD superfamily phosphohydrolase